MMQSQLFRVVRLFALAYAVFAASTAWAAAPVLMISIDGLKPEYVTHADEHGLRIPTLRRFMTEGVYADGVVGVLPTVTYPSHTTLITGVWPAEHGILNNQLFDPEKKFSGAWYWYAESIKVATLWDVAHQAGIGTASVSWPVSVNATSVDSLIPEYWRATNVGGGTNPQDRYLMNAISRPVGALDEMEQRLGPYMLGNNTTVEGGDEIRTKYALDIIGRRKPGFMTIHLSAMDDSEHEHGAFSAEAAKTLEAVDGMVARLMAAALKNDPTTKIVIVSDHGFLNVTHSVNLGIPFAQAGLMDLTPAGPAATWKAQFWSSGGMTAVILKDKMDTATREQVKAVLDKLAADQANGIDQVFDDKQVSEHGGFPNASFLVVMKPGYVAGAATSGRMVVEQTTVHGTHGFWPLMPEMRASFFAMGQGLAKGRDLGVIDMRQIAPTVAGIMGVNLPAAKQPKLHIEP
ncbi:alkaline phosphatase family protein [Terracidiphilus gabretensis]|uniref:alkaline phosphatase family protein n=1 Tax=Terracidiphilus gabretensis TaxID=1577687 RepID=UPI00071C0B35|nr:ectonucleotide pyrophosphatase/phosphodiesterase [Terracidiphilus gabretensis]